MVSWRQSWRGRDVETGREKASGVRERDITFDGCEWWCQRMGCCGYQRRGYPERRASAVQSCDT